MLNTLRQRPRRPWLDRWLPLLAMATVTGLIFWATADGRPVFGQPPKGKQKDVNKTKVDYDKKGKAPQVVTRPIPGAGKTVELAELAKIIDDEIHLRLKQEKIAPSPKADDAEFFRRAHLDLT